MKPASGEPRSIRLPRFETPDELRLTSWVQMVRTFYRLQRRIEQLLGAHDMTLPQFDVLATLSTGEGITQQELAERLLVTKGNVCGLLDRLEKAGWVERRTDPVDRRANRLYMAPAGRIKIDGVFREHKKLIDELLQPLSRPEIQSLRQNLETLENALGDD